MKNDPLVIITGAAGMIGSNVVRYLNDLGIKNLLLVDDLKRTDKWKNLVGKEFIDLISKHALFEWMGRREGKIDAIIHLGACSDTTERDGDYLLENNTHYTIRLAEIALKSNIRFIYASSAATYGDGSLGFDDDESKLEDLRPLNMYGYSKHLVDLWMKRQNVLDRVVGLKYFNVFGPNEYHKGKMASMVFKMTHIANQGEAIGLFKSNDPKNFTDGGQMRDFIYVKDAAKMTCQFLNPPYRSIGGIFNIGRGETVTWNQLAGYLFKALEKPKRINYIEMPKELHRQYQNFTKAEMEKLQKLIPLEYTQMEVAVTEYVQDYLLSERRW